MPKLRGKNQIVWLSFLLFAFFCISSYAQSMDDDKIVDEIGTGIVHGKNSAKARQEAVSSGLVSAVHLVLSDTISKETITNNFQILNDAIYSNILYFVKDYKVLTESVTGKTYRVMVQATISTSRISAKLSTLGIMAGKASYPNVLLLLAEKNINDKRPQYWWGNRPQYGRGPSERAMSEMMVQKGFKIINHPRSISGSRTSYNLDSETAAQLGKQFGADIVIYGQCIAGILSNTMGGDVKSFTAKIAVKTLKTETGEIVAEANKTSITSNMDDFTGSNEALNRAGLLAAEEISFKIIDVWQKGGGKKQELIEVTVEGTGGNIAHFVKFRSGISDMSGVDTLQLKEMMPDSATLLVDYKGSARAFADALMLRHFTGFGISIFDVTEGKISVRLVKK